MWIRDAAFLAWIFVCAAELSAQGPDEPRGGCFEGRPLPMCRTFWITDFAVTMRLDDDNFTRKRWDPPLVTWELGAMINVTPLSALGAALFAGIDGIGTLVGVRPRYRRWLAGDKVLDLAAGLYFNSSAPNAPTVTGQLDLGSDAVAFIGRVDFLVPRSRKDVHWNVGVKLGSTPGLATGLLVPPVALMIFCAVACGKLGSWGV